MKLKSNCNEFISSISKSCFLLPSLQHCNPKSPSQGCLQLGQRGGAPQRKWKEKKVLLSLIYIIYKCICPALKSSQGGQFPAPSLSAYTPNSPDEESDCLDCMSPQLMLFILDNDNSVVLRSSKTPGMGPSMDFL